MIFDNVVKTIKKNDLIENGDKIVIGLSGGPDSMALLHILNKLKESMDIQIYAAHLNHQLRGISSQEDALYVADICDKMGITCFVKSEDVSIYCKNNSLSIEEGARKLRYEMFDEIKNVTKSNKIAVGHNIDDQAETILMRLMRGTGLKGLKGIDYKREDGVIRPLLDTYKKDIVKYCEEHSLNPRIDESNLETIYTRNKVRLELIPYISENFNPNIIESIARMSNNIKNDSDYIEQNSLKIFNEVTTISQDEVILNIELYRDIHKAMKFRVIRLAIENLIGDTKGFDQKHTNDVLEFECDSKIGKMLTLPRGIFCYRKLDTIIFTNKEIIGEDINFCYNIPNTGFIKIEEISSMLEMNLISKDKYNGMKRDENSVSFDFSKIKGKLSVCSREPKNKIKLSNGSKKVKDLLIDLKIPKEIRSSVPIIKDEEEILSVGNYRISENKKIDSQTKEVLRISFKKL